VSIFATTVHSAKIYFKIKLCCCCGNYQRSCNSNHRKGGLPTLALFEKGSGLKGGQAKPILLKYLIIY